MAENVFGQIFATLFAHYGPQCWWPAETPFEMAVGAVLTQNTNWKNASKAIFSLKQANLLSPLSIDSISHEELAFHIQPAGYYNLKAKRLKNLVRMLVEEYGGDLKLLAESDWRESREKLLSVKGVGEETADSILLYACSQPVFVVDTYTHRVFSRHNLLEEECSYSDIQERFMDNLPADAALFNEYHALIVRVAKDFCKKTSPLCSDCPLSGL
ncbi:MAG: endonuclease III domain-containing protein [Desulfopila sp.]|jgi:endonuclease-3 related protein|nr:endonuclease III domain-containing protein [Desulfopila sp.]